MQIFRIIKKFRQILSRHQKVRIVELGMLMVIGGFLEMCSVSLMLPFMNIVLNPEESMKNRYVVWICGVLDISSQRTFLVLLALVLAVIYVFKNAFLLFQLNAQNRFVYNNQFNTQRQLLHNLVMRPYEYFLDIDSGEVLRVISSDTIQTFLLLTNLLTFFSETVVSATLIITILVISPVVTFAMAVVLLISIFLIMTIIRPIMRRATIRTQKASAAMNRWLLQSIQGIKELKIMRKESFFEKEYNRNGQVYVAMNRSRMTLTQAPRYILEAVSMGSFLVVIAAMIYRGMELESVIPVLSVVAVAAIRLLPSVNRISQCMGTMATNEPYLDKMIENLREASRYERGTSIDGESRTVGRLSEEFSLEHVSYRYPSGNHDVLSDASMRIRVGQSIGIVGASGSGKTTAVDILLGLLKPREGAVLADGMDVRLDMDGWLSQIGYIPQAIFMLDGSVRDNVAFGVPAERVDDGKVWESLREAALSELIETLPDGLDTEVGERGVRLSGGQRQRMGIARALYTDPSILFFDEATSALDNETERAVMESIEGLHGSRTIVIIAHRLTTIDGCDHVFRIANGKVVRER